MVNTLGQSNEMDSPLDAPLFAMKKMRREALVATSNACMGCHGFRSARDIERKSSTK